MNNLAFERIKGQSYAKKILGKELKAGHVGHAYLFVGIDGIGKRMMAKAFAEALLNPDNNLQQRKKIMTDNHPDVRYVKDKPQRIGVERIRDLKQHTQIPPYESKYKVFIIDQAHLLTVQAQNAFLKILEEPLSYIVFILITNNVSSLLPTVISRCETIRFTPLAEQCMIEILAEQGYTGEVATLACTLSQGSVERALQFCQDIDWPEVQSLLQQILRAVVNKDRFGLFALAAKIANNDQSLHDILNYLEFTYQSLLRQKIGGQGQMTLPIVEDIYQRLSLDQIFRGSQAISAHRKMLTRYQNKQLVLETLFLKLQEG